MNDINSLNKFLGIFISLIIISLWFFSLKYCLFYDICGSKKIFLPFIIFIRTFLQTGLFITAHDAMHETIFTENQKINCLIGSTSTTLYAFLMYKPLLVKHKLHHSYPSSASDPDFYDGQKPIILSWYFKFMKSYFEPKQIWIVIGGISFVFALGYALNISNLNLITFWILPMILSSFQLFYFGTFLPHRRTVQGYIDRHCARSTGYSAFWSFLACYHFGYHWEHHAYPNTPWYRLPLLRHNVPSSRI
ncbi:MAG: beta-carotene ketolase [Acaryochloridaceae cyanobacterium RU_4_10]|nr:beta-carotene ketolase [Acaryochloridaceae cyanobacterium RU_4_10]